MKDYMMDVKLWIKKHEGLKLSLYKDTVDKTTIGWGRNIEDNGISLDEAELMFENDLNHCIHDLSIYSWYNDSPQHIKDCLLDMCFNLGINRLLEFKSMLKYIEEKNFTQAAIQALNSKWAKQVKSRATDVATLMRQGYA